MLHYAFVELESSSACRTDLVDDFEIRMVYLVRILVEIVAYCIEKHPTMIGGSAKVQRSLGVAFCTQEINRSARTDEQSGMDLQ